MEGYNTFAFIFEEGMIWKDFINSSYNVQLGTSNKLFEENEDGAVTCLLGDDSMSKYCE